MVYSYRKEDSKYIHIYEYRSSCQAQERQVLDGHNERTDTAQLEISLYWRRNMSIRNGSKSALGLLPPMLAAVCADEASDDFASVSFIYCM